MRTFLMVQILVIFLTGCQSHPGAATDTGAQTRKPIDIAARKKRTEQSPGDVKAWISLGNGLFDTNQWVEAIDAYRRALKLDGKNVDVRVDLGTCYRNANMPQSAIKEYRAAIAINPKHVNARRNAGVVLAYDLDKPKEAIMEFEKYLKLDPNSPDREAIRKAIDDLKAKVKP